MEYRLLGLSGCAVSVLALGPLTFGNDRLGTRAANGPFGRPRRPDPGSA
jgi:aryl-alcohol dehydrogenase-like predicted oxidoreductase